MTALHRVKAYFGMVPADELDAYDGYDDRDGDRYADRYDDRRRPAERHSDRHAGRYADRYDDRRDDRRDDRYDDRFEDRYDGRRHEADRHGAGRFDGYDADRHDGDRYPGERRAVSAVRADDGPPAPRPRDARDVEVPESRREESEVETSRSSRGRSWATNTGPNHTSVRPTSVSGSRPTPSLTPVGSSPSGGPSSVGGNPTRGSLAVDESRQEAPATPAPPPETEPETPAPAEITSLQPTSYNEARVIGERYRDGIPVIMNLTDMDEVAAKRLVDFAAGLAFALRGSIEKVTNRVFLLSPPNVEVSAAERRKLAATSYTTSS